MQAPFHILEKAGASLAAANGPKISIFDLATGALLSTWSCPRSGEVRSATPEPEVSATPTVDSPAAEGSPAEPAAKRRKVSEEQEEKSGQQGEEKKAKKAKRPQHQQPEVPFVTCLKATSDGQYLVAVTGEDKTIRVFSKDEQGKLTQLSERPMPKRPCSIDLTKDERTIVSADKFGDVYSLPLFPSEVTERSREASAAAKEVKSFVPAASTLTVHSQRNRTALENQLKMKKQHVEKTGPDFEHQLLLGHVSMLTKVMVAQHENRSYIVTADRDEHIRVSRGIPQAHIIESFCLGHDEFVNALCCPSTHSNVLISGGGEDTLFVWNWPTGELLSKADLRELLPPSLDQVSGNGEESDGKTSKIAVSFIHHVPIEGSSGQVIVAVEGIPKLFSFSLNEGKTLAHVQTVSLDGNPLDLVTKANGEIVVSVDGVYESGLGKTLRPSPWAASEFLQTFKWQGSSWDKEAFAFKPSEDSSPDVTADRLTNLLYGLETLRKRDGDDD